MKSIIVHYKNKYPGGKIHSSENAIDVFDANGAHAVALRKDGANMWVDQSEELGCDQKHCLSPIPKDARVHKVVAGKIGLDEKAGDRKELSKEFQLDGRVLSCEELAKVGFEFDEKQRVSKRPTEKK